LNNYRKSNYCGFRGLQPRAVRLGNLLQSFVAIHGLSKQLCSWQWRHMNHFKFFYFAVVELKLHGLRSTRVM